MSREPMFPKPIVHSVWIFFFFFFPLPLPVHIFMSISYRKNFLIFSSFLSPVSIPSRPSKIILLNIVVIISFFISKMVNCAPHYLQTIIASLVFKAGSLTLFPTHIQPHLWVFASLCPFQKNTSHSFMSSTFDAVVSSACPSPVPSAFLPLLTHTQTHT